MSSEYGSKIRTITRRLRESYYKTATEEKKKFP